MMIQLSNMEASRSVSIHLIVDNYYATDNLEVTFDAETSVLIGKIEINNQIARHLQCARNRAKFHS